jgi:ABC-type dipeptide/oligopeptide/nickel transport system permease subunit
VTTDAAALAPRRRRPLAFLRSWPARIGIASCALLALLAILGPYLAPHDTEAIIGLPVDPPTREFPFGTDPLGRDVMSRVLWGGRSLLGYACLATIVAYVIGATIGLVAGFKQGRLGSLLMRTVDLLLVFPPLLLLLLLISGLGTGMSVVLFGIVVLHVPSIARVVYAATLETAVRGYVEAAVARGETLRYILSREILPNITGTIAADAGPRITVSIFVIAGLNFLGLGLQPPTPDWALMITENRRAIELQPWAVAVPVLLIAAVTLAINLTADAVVRSSGRTIDVGEMARR